MQDSPLNNGQKIIICRQPPHLHVRSFQRTIESRSSVLFTRTLVHTVSYVAVAEVGMMYMYMSLHMCMILHKSVKLKDNHTKI